ncbi:MULTISPECIES: SDR family NAD(P)-dependent oxidoreductase [unclassified Pseudomonas]|uniref:SDR family NAD(P)-dependent oxidoreductase n=1 Tax=unclassified Pseudomonas TaxID=196821 RepID=UPI000BD6F07E|nr:MULTISPECIES: SDR family NAD(P)-dependent oxidoreductase [unclassified Pseudomonas]PVZ20613.1 NAD(P)-dependent dehydrogenase (short-subunit alcohol dehydrogenase family) [Pseudomonas sp. URIL14HWK12:I12]PVZ27679.1 NAD(P)-dependent dehydrogenase (short-subunit alcohol dehydrogenase family) [Pseudomonas sp. URIL14HWK12:I10]PVZ38568.1 NAD(P)-dependent dehydrogenase (short-subunit alcohol dehydrogenase family) [Pseudomonas sp. URIL14HWK12:I11]SNZ02838.1 NAD(P)-dependent dehydrogenase, short-chai
MICKQFPLHSGYGAATTAAELLKEGDLLNTTAVVTGGHSGLGLETTRALAAAGAHVIVGARDVQAARANIGGISNVHIEQLDLSDLASVHGFTQRLLARDRHVDILIGSAGIMACPEGRVGAGWEAQFATNHLGHYALVNGLWPVLTGGARVVMVSSAGHHQSDIRWGDVQFTKGYDKWLAYGQSKTANALFAVHLDRVGQAEGVRAFSLHPGKILTPLQRHLPRDEMIAAGWLDADGNLADPTFKTPEQGAATQVWAATSAQLAGLGGVYCEDCDIASVDAGEPPSFVGVRPYAADPERAERLWALSARLTGIDAFDRA